MWRRVVCWRPAFSRNLLSHLQGRCHISEALVFIFTGIITTNVTEIWLTAKNCPTVMAVVTSGSSCHSNGLNGFGSETCRRTDMSFIVPSISGLCAKITLKHKPLSFCVWLVLNLVYFVFHYDSFLGAFAKLRKAIVSYVMSVRLSAWNNLAPTEHIFMKFIWIFFENLSRKLKFNSNWTRLTGTLHEDLYTLLIKYRLFSFRMRKVSNKSCRESQNTYFKFINDFFRKSCSLWDNV